MSNATESTNLVTILLIILGALLLVPLLFAGFGMMGSGHVADGMWGSGAMMDGSVSGWLLAVWILMRVLFLVAIVGGVYIVVRAIQGREADTDPALEELRQTYARGELSDEEFEQRRERLERDR